MSKIMKICVWLVTFFVEEFWKDSVTMLDMSSFHQPSRSRKWNFIFSNFSKKYSYLENKNNCIVRAAMCSKTFHIALDRVENVDDGLIVSVLVRNGVRVDSFWNF